MELRTDFIDTNAIDTSKSWDEWSKASRHNSKVRRIVALEWYPHAIVKDMLQVANIKLEIRAIDGT